MEIFHDDHCIATRSVSRHAQMAVFFDAADIGQQLFHERLKAIPLLPVLAPIRTEVRCERGRFAETVLPDREDRILRVGIFRIRWCGQDGHRRMSLRRRDHVPLEFGHPFDPLQDGRGKGDFRCKHLVLQHTAFECFGFFNKDCRKLIRIVRIIVPPSGRFRDELHFRDFHPPMRENGHHRHTDFGINELCDQCRGWWLWVTIRENDHMPRCRIAFHQSLQTQLHRVLKTGHITDAGSVDDRN